MPPTLPIEDVVECVTPPPVGEKIGSSREGRHLFGYRFGRGPRHVSLVGGCHADEPVGPSMLDRLASRLSALPDDDPLLSELSWWIVVRPQSGAR